MHALAEPPVSEPPVSPTTIGADAPPTLHFDQRRVVVRLSDGETVLVGGAPSYEDALVLAQKTILKLGDGKDDEWPMLGERFSKMLLVARWPATPRLHWASWLLLWFWLGNIARRGLGGVGGILLRFGKRQL